MEVGSLNLDLSVSLAKFHSALNSAVKRVSELGREMERAVGPAPRREIDRTQSRLSQFTWAARGYIKDTSKVITGILISQGFYKLLNTIESAVGSVFEFNNQVQTAAISFRYLLGGTKQAEAFIQQLQDFAADTPFAFEQAVKLSQQLLAYGLPKDNILYALQTILDAAAVRSGGADAIEGIGRALGQMAAKSKVEAQELRQLAEWGVPAYQILQEQLGLTADQIQEIGRVGIPGIKGVQAILTGLEKRYKDASQEVARTTSGLVEKISDNLKIISNVVFAPALNRFRQFLAGIADRLEQLRSIVRTRGIGGLFEALFPPNLRGTVKSVITGIVAIVRGLQSLWAAIRPIASAVGEVILRLLGLVLPLLGLVTRTVGSLAQWLTSSIPLVRQFVGALSAFIITALVVRLLSGLVAAIRALAIAGPVAKLILYLRDAILALHVAISRNPIIGLITLASAALIGLALSSQTASRWLDIVMQKIGALLGLNIDQAFEPTDPQAITNWLNSYNQSLADASKNLVNVGDDTSKVGDDASKAGKKVEDKFLAAFDEVYQVPEKLGDVSDALKGIGDVGDIGVPSIPDLPPLPAPSVDTSKWESTGQGLLDKLKKFLEDLGKSMRDQHPLIIPAPTFQPPLGVPAENLRVFLEQLQVAYAEATAGVREWVRQFNEGLQQLGQPLLDAYGRVRQVVDQMTGALQTLPTSVATALSGAYTAVHGVIGQLVGELQSLPSQVAGVLTSYAQTVVSFFGSVITSVEGFIKGIVTSLETLPAQAADILNAFGQRVSEVISGAVSFLDQNKGLIIGILAAVAIAVGAWVLGLPATVMGGIAAFVMAVTTMFSNAKQAAAAELTATQQQVTNQWEQIKQAIYGKLTGIWQDVSNQWKLIKQTVFDYLSGIGTDISTGWEGIKTTIATALDDILSKVSEVWDGIKRAIGDKISETATLVSSQWNSIKTSLENIWNGINVSASNIWSAIRETVRGQINYIIELIDKFIRKINSIQIHVPSFTIPFVGTFGGFTISMPQIPEIPLLDVGGIVTRDTLARLAGNNRPEAVIPLTGESARPFAEMIADAITSAMPETTVTSLPPMYVGTLIADERGLKELARKVEIINLREAQRRGLG